MGSYMEHITANDEATKDRLMKGLAASSTVTEIGNCSTYHKYLEPTLSAPSGISLFWYWAVTLGHLQALCFKKLH